MIQNKFLPNREGEILQWIVNFENKIPKYAPKYGITKEEVDYIKKARALLSWTRNNIIIVKGSYSSLVAFKDELLGNVRNVAKPSGLPSLPTFEEAPELVANDILGFIRSLAARIKANLNYTKADGEDMGLEGSKVSEDVNEAQPALSLVRVAEGVKGTIVKGNMDGYKVTVSIDKGEPIVLGSFTRSSFIHKITIKEGEKHVLLEYTVRFIKADKEVGKESDVVSIII